MANAPTVTVTQRSVVNGVVWIHATLTAGADTYGNGGKGLKVPASIFGLTTLDVLTPEPLDSGLTGIVSRVSPQWDSANSVIRLYYQRSPGAGACVATELPGPINMGNTVIRVVVIGR